MQINLSNIFNEQKKLDAIIHKNHNVKYVDVINELIVALSVELGELANEVRCFKFWSFKQPSPKTTILEEYADGIHFITSICIMYNVEPIFDVNHQNITTDKKQLSKKFRELFDLLQTLDNIQGIKNWYIKYIELGFSLGFNIIDIINAYNAKHQKNIDRQNNNY